MSTPRIGEHGTAVCGESKLVGTCRSISETAIVLQNDGDDGFHGLDPIHWSWTPDEPEYPPGTWWLAADGLPWRRSSAESVAVPHWRKPGDRFTYDDDVPVRPLRRMYVDGEP